MASKLEPCVNEEKGSQKTSIWITNITIRVERNYAFRNFDFCLMDGNNYYSSNFGESL